MGTPHYMAPEQALGLKDVDHRVDLYALGVVLFECLTGTLPFEADSELRLIQMQAHAPPPDIIDRAPWVSRPVADVVRKALAKSPLDRFDSAAELVAALENAYRASKGHTAPPPRPSADADWAQASVGPNTAPSLRSLAGTETPPPVVVGVDLAPPHSVGVAPRPAPRWTWILGLFAALGLGFGGWYLAARNTPLPPLAVALDVDAGAVEVALEATDAGVELVLALEEADAGASEDDGADAGSLALEPADPKVPRPRRRIGRVNIITTHAGDSYWAQVSIDGVARGRTPLLLDLPVGSHQVRIDRAGFKSQAREIRVASGKPTVLRIDLIP